MLFRSSASTTAVNDSNPADLTIAPTLASPHISDLGSFPSISIPASTLFPLSTMAPNTTTSSPIPSTHESSPIAFAGASTTPTIISAPVDNTNEINGLIAGIAVLGALFLAMTGALIWTTRRKRCELDNKILD